MSSPPKKTDLGAAEWQIRRDRTQRIAHLVYHGDIWRVPGARAFFEFETYEEHVANQQRRWHEQDQRRRDADG